KSRGLGGPRTRRPIRGTRPQRTVRAARQAACCSLTCSNTADSREEINGEQPTLFRWVMHWPAALNQRPGYHIGTALWFVGRRGGVGKGTLLQILSQLLGDCYIGKLDADEMCRGWTTSRRSAQTPAASGAGQHSIKILWRNACGTVMFGAAAHCSMTW